MPSSVETSRRITHEHHGSLLTRKRPRRLLKLISHDVNCTADCEAGIAAAASASALAVLSSAERWLLCVEAERCLQCAERVTWLPEKLSL